MADPLQQINANVVRIDAPFPEQWREEMYQFVSEMAAIKDSLDVLSTNVARSSEATNKLADWYSEGGKSPLASQAIAEMGQQTRVLDQYGRPLGASDAATVQQALGGLGEQAGVTGQVPKEQTPSRPPDSKLDEAQDWLKSNPVTMPQHYGGKYTATDLLTLIAQFANKQYDSSVKAGEPSETWGKYTKGFTSLAQTYVPNIQAGFGLAQAYGGAAKQWSAGLSDYASSLGFEPGSGIGLGPIGSANNVDLGILGSYRLPLLNSSALSGAGSTIEAWSSAMNTPGLSTSQAMGMYQSLAERGWYPGKSQTHALFDLQSHLVSKGGVFQGLAEDPATMDLVDKATRSGTASMDQMLKTIESIPDAAKTANEGITQMVADMNSFGELSQSQGGTHFAGQQQALEIAQATGLPAASSLGMLNSPWATSAIFRQTGQPEWMQGSLPGGVKNQASMKAFFEAARVVGRPKGYQTKDFAGGTHTVSGIEQQAAMMHKFMYPDMPVEQIMKRLRMGQSGAIGRSKVEEALGNWRSDALTMLKEVKQGDLSPDQLDTWISGGETQGANFGNLLQHMQDLKTAEGKRMFSQEDIRTIREAGQGKHGEDLVQAKYSAVQQILDSKAKKQSDNSGSPGNQVTIDLSPAARKFLQLPNKRSQMKLSANGGSGQNINSSYTGYTDPLTPPAGMTMGNQIMGANGSFYQIEE